MIDQLARLARGRDRAREDMYVCVLRDAATGAMTGHGDDGIITITPQFAIEVADELDRREAQLHDLIPALQAARGAAILARRERDRIDASWLRIWFVIGLVQVIGASPVSLWADLWRALTQ